MHKFLIFGGTFEGRRICQFFSDRKEPVLVSVATDYGREMLRSISGLDIHVQRLDKQGMIDFMRQKEITCVIHATHPYAVEVGRNINEACDVLGLKKIRVLRGQWQPEEAIVVNSAVEAASFLNTVEESALLATGSKELEIYTHVKNYQTRLFARVLPDPDVLIGCHKLGFRGRHLIAIQGPFSKDMNVAMLNDFGCFYLVSKDGGSTGGLLEKIKAVQETKGRLILISRPADETGLNLDEALDWVTEMLASVRPLAH